MDVERDRIVYLDLDYSWLSSLTETSLSCHCCWGLWRSWASPSSSQPLLLWPSPPSSAPPPPPRTAPPPPSVSPPPDHDRRCLVLPSQPSSWTSPSTPRAAWAPTPPPRRPSSFCPSPKDNAPPGGQRTPSSSPTPSRTPHPSATPSPSLSPLSPPPGSPPKP